MWYCVFCRFFPPHKSYTNITLIDKSRGKKHLQYFIIFISTFILSNYHSPFYGCMGTEPILLDIQQEQDIRPGQVVNLSQADIHRRDKQPFTLAFTPTGYLELPINLMCMSVDWAQECPQSPLRHEKMKRRSKVQMERPLLTHFHPKPSCCEPVCYC